MHPAHAHYNFGLVVPKVEVPNSKPDWIMLAQVALCVVPAMGIVMLGSPSVGAKWFYTVMLLLLAWFLLRRDRLRFVSLILSLVPALMMLRAFSFYNSVSILMGTGIILWFFASPKEFSQAWKDFRWRSLLILGGLYWLLSYLWTGYYASNLRVLELIFSAACVYLLAKHREYLATALIGLSISVFSVGIAFMPRSGADRWGHEAIDGYILGNPITFGIPLALIFLLSIADNGKWLLLENRRSWRLALCLISGAFLVLSTSRGSWAIVIVNVIVLLLIGKRQRGMLLASIAFLAVITLALLATQRGEFLTDFYDKTFSPDRNLAQRSSGRSDQWQIFPQVFKDSPIWGFGPGSGSSVYGKYSILEENEVSLKGDVAWHSLYLQVGVETGIIGLIGLTFLFASLLFRGFTHWRIHDSSAPLIGIIGFMVIGLSVSALDAVSGIFLGVGFLSAKSVVARRFKWELGGEHNNPRLLLRNRASTAKPAMRSRSAGL
ncbi:MAG: O-antigen ligase family protein [Pyrinomonadaceae bacterium]|nr:O-antigen ligase family protein [Pyrinomonadaceae bacterium]